MKPSVLIVTHEYLPYPGGIGRYCASLARAAGSAGYSVTVIAPDYGAPIHAEDVTEAVRVTRFPGDLFRLGQLARYRQLIRDHLSQRHYDYVLAADWPAILAIASIPTPGSHRLAMLHGTDVLMFHNSFRLRLARAGGRLGTFARLICNSDFTRGLLIEHYPRYATRADTVPLGVDQRWFGLPSSEALHAFGARIERAEEDLVVLTVARLDSRKGQAQTLDALARLPAALRKRVKYVCVGRTVEPSYVEQLRAQALSAGLSLVLTGSIPDEELLAAYNSADVFSLTASAQRNKVEGFGLVLLEAAAQGLPSVVTPVDAIPEVIADGHTGQVAATPEALANAFERLLLGDRGTWRANCIGHARRYSWDACARATFQPPR